MKFEIIDEFTPEDEVGDRKLTRVGGSVMVALPKVIRRAVNLGVGDRVKMWPVGTSYIVIQKFKGVLDGIVRRRD